MLLLSEKHEFLCVHSESKSSLNKYFILKTNRQLFVRRERSRACTCSELQLSPVQLVTVAWTILNFCQRRMICNVNSKWIELSKYFIVLLLRLLYRIWGNFSHLTYLMLHLKASFTSRELNWIRVLNTCILIELFISELRFVQCVQNSSSVYFLCAVNEALIKSFQRMMNYVYISSQKISPNILFLQ